MADQYTTPKTYTAEVATSADRNTYERDNITALKNALDGDNSASTLRHKHRSGTLAARPAAGNAGRVYIATDGGSQRAFFDDGTVWLEVPLLDTSAIAAEDSIKWDGSNFVPYALPSSSAQVLAADGTVITVANTTTQTTLASFTLLDPMPAWPGVIYIEAWGELTMNAAGNLVLRLRYSDGVGLGTFVALDAADSATKRNWRLRCVMPYGETGATLAMEFMVSDTASGPSAVGLGSVHYFGQFVEGDILSVSPGLDMEIRATWSAASPSLSIRKDAIVATVIGS